MIKIIKNMPLSTQIIIAMIAGLLIGATSQTVFLGVDALANAFVMLLQMTALPYIALSLIIGIGGLSPIKAQNALKQSMVIIIALIAVVLFFILLAPLAFPDWPNADFYSASITKVSEELNLITLFIPTNPFHAFANGLIPAVVLFSLFLGIGLMRVKGKKHTLLVLNSFNGAIVNISNMVMRLAPIGIFCIGLRAAATIDSSQLDGLLVYIVTAMVLVLLLSFVILPAIVATISPFSYRQIIKASREAMITAFATGSFFIVIPIIVEKCKLLIHQLEAESSNLPPKASSLKDVSQLPSIIIPISFSLPIGGKLLALLFTLFAAWFSGSEIEFSSYINLIIAGVPQLFGSNTLAMPNLLELFNLPSSMFDFFIVAENLMVGRLGALLSVICSLSLALLIATSMMKKFTFKWHSFNRYLIVLPIISVLAFISLRFTFDAISYQYQGYSKFIDRDFILLDLKAKVLEQADNIDNAPSNTTKSFSSALNRIEQRGFIRVGYFRDDLPYSFHNKQGKLVGFDIEIINLLAADLNVNIEFVRIYHKQAQPLLASGYLDMTTGMPVLPNNMKKYTLTIPYSTQAAAFLVKDSRREEFAYWHKILPRKDLIIGVPEIFYSENQLKHYFKQSKVWEISTPRLFFREKYQHIDAMLIGAATASAWTLLHPEYSVIAPKPIQEPFSMAFAINRNDHAFELFMRNWITMKKQSKTIDKLFDYWIAGKKLPTLN